MHTGPDRDAILATMRTNLAYVGTQRGRRTRQARARSDSRERTRIRSQNCEGLDDFLSEWNARLVLTSPLLERTVKCRGQFGGERQWAGPS
jgi:hypothetical protein